jgi:hypothetical protein
MAETPLKFNKGLIHLIINGITLIQKGQYKNLNTINIKTTISTSSRGTTRTLIPKDQYVAQRIRRVYIALVY